MHKLYILKRARILFWHRYRVIHCGTYAKASVAIAVGRRMVDYDPSLVYAVQS